MKEKSIERKSYSWGRAYEVSLENNEKLILPSVTTVLKLITEPKYKKIKGEFGEEKWQIILDNASFRGNVMHLMLENFLLEYSNSRDIEKCLISAQTTSKNIELENRGSEALVKKGRDLFWNFYHESFWTPIKRVLYNEVFLWSDFRGGWAGTTDFVFEDFYNDHVIIDFKSSTSPKEEEDILSYKCQISAYMFAYAERYGIIPQRGEIWIANEKDMDIQKFIVSRDEFKIYLKKFLELVKEFKELNNIN